MLSMDHTHLEMPVSPFMGDVKTGFGPHPFQDPLWMNRKSFFGMSPQVISQISHKLKLSAYWNLK